MHLKQALAIISICLASSVQSIASELRFESLGFTIQPLENTSEVKPFQALLLFLPTSDNFAPNTNVQIQEFDGTIQEYLALTKSQFQQANLTFIKTPTINSNQVLLEYTGDIGQGPLRWYARAIKHGNTVYLVTATAKASQWSTVSEKLIRNVQSFKLTD